MALTDVQVPCETCWHVEFLVPDSGCWSGARLKEKMATLAMNRWGVVSVIGPRYGSSRDTLLFRYTVGLPPQRNEEFQQTPGKRIQR